MNVPEETVLSPPKATAQTAGSPVALSLNIKHPLAVKDALVKLTSSKSQHAVVESNVGVMLVKAAPFAVYPVPVISSDVVYAVVPAPKVAELV